MNFLTKFVVFIITLITFEILIFNYVIDANFTGELLFIDLCLACIFASYERSSTHD